MVAEDGANFKLARVSPPVYCLSSVPGSFKSNSFGLAYNARWALI